MMHWRSSAARASLRLRLVAGFSAAMLLVLAAAGAFVYWRVAFALDRQVNEDLSDVSRRVAAVLDPSGQLVEGASLTSNEAYQVFDSNGRVLNYSLSIGPEPLLEPAVARGAFSSPLRRDIGRMLPISPHPLRAYAVGLAWPQPQRAAILVVAVRRDHRDEALRELLVQLLVAGIGALVVTALVGERLARLALQPVERYRAQAADIIAGAAGVRVDVPPGRDDEVTRLGHTLNAMLDALEDALKGERRFVNDASHELRTPLTLLKTRVQLALRRPRTVTEHEEILAEIQTDIIRLTQLADQLLRVGTSPYALDDNPELTDLAAVVGEEVARRHRPDSRPDVELTLSTENPVLVTLRRTEATQLITNLLDNADLHGRPPIIVTVDKVDESGRIQVTDHGDGMDPELLATATQRFRRAAAARSRPGFGLGLSLVEAIILGARGELRLCYGGLHHRLGPAHLAPCRHGSEMTVTVFLPCATNIAALEQPLHRDAHAKAPQRAGLHQ